MQLSALSPISKTPLPSGNPGTVRLGQPVLQFGCRLMAMMNSGMESQVQADTIDRYYLKPGGGSLYDQSKFRSKSDLDKDRTQYESIFKEWLTGDGKLHDEDAIGTFWSNGDQRPYMSLDLHGVYNVGQPDGWGITTYKNGAVLLHRKERPPAFLSPLYRETVETAKTQNPDVVMGHLRLGSKSVGKAETGNAHPFHYGVLTFMHNGSAYIARTPGIVKVINDNVPGLEDWTADDKTDSEAAFYYIVARLLQEYPTKGKEEPLDRAHVDRIGADNIARVVGETVHSFIKESPGESSNKDFPEYWGTHKMDYSVQKGDGTPRGLEIQGTVELSPVCNFILSDGNFLLASRAGIHELFLGVEQEKAEGHQDHLSTIIASEPIAPDNRDPNTQTYWMQIPDRTLLMIRKRPDHPRVTAEFSALVDYNAPKLPRKQLNLFA